VSGMGGSSLAAEVFSLVYPESDKGLKVHVLDSTDPEAVAGYDASLDPEKTLRLIASKSGTTTETLAFLAHQFDADRHRHGILSPSRPGDHYVSITDPGRALTSLPHHDVFRETFLNPADVGGRYSALTYVGLVPAALLRLDIDALLDDAILRAEASRPDDRDNAALVIGAALAALSKSGRDKLTFVIEPDLAPFGAWLEQLIAESTGKRGVGIVPVDGEPLAAPDAYGDDRVFLRLGPGNDREWHAEVDARLDALSAAGHPLIDVRLDDASWVAGEFFRWQFATAVAGIGLGINPFDQPNVVESKSNTTRMLRIFEDTGSLPSAATVATLGPLRVHTQLDDSGDPRGGSDVAGTLRDHLARSTDDGYLQIAAYLAPTPARTEALRTLQAKLRDGTRRATTLGYGPRFLHSTGQLHKGGAPIGSFIQIVAGHPEDVDIPGRKESFGTLISAQALGDFEALGTHDLPAIRIDIGDDIEAGLTALVQAFDEALA